MRSPLIRLPRIRWQGTKVFPERLISSTCLLEDNRTLANECFYIAGRHLGHSNRANFRSYKSWGRGRTNRRSQWSMDRVGAYKDGGEGKKPRVIIGPALAWVKCRLRLKARLLSHSKFLDFSQ
jgi:hypothetical protein